VPESERPVCALPVGDPWMENILRPIIVSAGYRVVPADRVAPGEVDVLIASAEDEEIAISVPSADILRIRSSVEREHDADDSIYRYDRAGLLGALGMRAAARRKG
jgi:two-component system chemotaxis sensor kinase CheA